MNTQPKSIAMKLKAAAALLAVAIAAPAMAGDFDDYARVVNVTPRYEKVNYPKRECYTEYEQVRQQRSVGGAIIGGVAGGLLGGQVGRGRGRTAAAAVGAITGAIVGDRIDNDDYDRVVERPVRTCRKVDNWESRVDGYDVTYEYHGRTYTTVMPYDPGDRLPVNVSVSPRG
jgi:uncharacterized protein YcfJ